MGEFYEVAFKRECKGLFEDAGQGGINVGDYVVVASEQGEEIGQVTQKGDLTELKGKGREVGRVVRRATPEDVEQLQERRRKEAEALLVCRQKVVKHNLKMKPLDVEYEYDGSRITFYFTANGRIDFRELVKDLARTYRTRIELRQIGFRVETKRMGGFGICGRSLCCAAFIQKPSPVPIQVARDQALSQNASKLTGVCGQLKCCLTFEQAPGGERCEQAPGAGCASCCRGSATEGDGVLRQILQAQDEEEGPEELPLVEAQGAQANEVEVR
ncbi:MAG: hypothetical protein A3F84_22240 [Candidatus Handelsmanbacteria bacterium RIFCSPLOWO2_12_FULL_64_10]|uniref:PSP1 C-terminal domain-containing protein n=1 Tax=Handelsmanbacteria sp. (strain RIFCSPLOWO2_12_FULL_64_10) TaxID=1817868 RepID=A0A1F6D4U3_HANXR|nr:MAG: hypothetical protein A3F84_22240 [Candidatus Handelsmanbacteria bacterium RIFCSPLOWO2_12_FULL_64_10]